MDFIGPYRKKDRIEMKIIKYIIIFVALFALTACQTRVKNYGAEKRTVSGVQCKKIMARVTFYHPHEDKWGSRIASSNGRAKEGRTIAAEKAFPFYQKIQIESLAGKVGDGHFNVEDRGTAVEKRKASRGQYPVFDVFVQNRKKMKQLEDLYIEPVPVTVCF